MMGVQLPLDFNAPPQAAPVREAEPPKYLENHAATDVALASGEKTKARDILAAIRTLKQLERERRPASAEERQTLARFAGFGPVALSIFPDPVTGRYKDAGWQTLGEELRSLLTDEEWTVRQAHHLQRLLYLLNRHPRHVPRAEAPRRAR